MINQNAAAFHAIPEGYPQPKDAEELVNSIDHDISDKDRVPTPPDGDEYAFSCLLRTIGD
jgi:hypothetical protein